MPHQGCGIIANNLTQPPNHPNSSSATNLCSNPCWEEAAMACQDFNYPSMSQQLVIPEDFCAVDEQGEYCHDLLSPLDGSWTCEELQVCMCR